ncbi:MAG: hypothetical protein QOI61_1434 [Actinomycetota bacterium]
MKLLRPSPRRRDRGAVLVLAIPAMVLCIAAAALGVDIGRIAVDKRSDQKVADMAALDAARAVGFILGTTNQAGYNTAAQAAATAAVARNEFVVGQDGHTVTAVVGTINSTTNQFSPGGSSAVKVTTTSHIDNAFLPGGRDLTAEAVALVGSPTGSFSVGSTLASLDTSKSRIDPVLQGMLGISASMAAVSYQGIAGGNVSLRALQTALLNLGYNAGTVDDLLTTSIKVADLFRATANALTVEGQNVAAAEINDMPLASISSSLTVQLGDLVKVASPNDSAMLDAKLNAYQLVTGAAQVANGTNFISVPLVGVSLPGLAGVALSAYVIEPAKTAIGPVGTTAENAQVRMKVNVDVGLGFLLPVAHVELTYTTAQAIGTLTSIACGSSPSMGISASTAAVTVAGVATTTAGTMNVSSSIAASGPTALSFSYPSEFGPTTSKHVGTGDAGLSLTSVSVTANTPGTVVLAPLLQVALPTVLVSLDTALQASIRPLFAALGLDIASADVAALGIFPDAQSCGGHPRLAQ